MPAKDRDSSIPELIKRIRYSFRECEFDEVRNALMGREESMKGEIENLARERDSLKNELDSLQITQGFTELEKCSAEEKLGRSERRCEKLDKVIVRMREDIEKLRGEKSDLEEKVARSSTKAEKSDESLVEMQKENDKLRSEKTDLEEKIVSSSRKLKEKDESLALMEEEVVGLRRENAYVNKSLEKLKARKIEADCIVEELKLNNVEAVQTIDELRAKKIESDKAIELYERVISDLNRRILKLEGTIAKDLSVNVEDLGSLAKGTDSFAAAATDVRVEERVVVSPEVAATSGVGNLPQSRTKMDDANIVITSKPACNSPVAESDATVQDNEGKECEVRGSRAGPMQSDGELAAEKTTASSPATGNDVIVVSESDGDDDEIKRDRRRDSAVHRSRKRKRNTGTTTVTALHNVEYVDLEDDPSFSQIQT